MHRLSLLGWASPVEHSLTEDCASRSVDRSAETTSAAARLALHIDASMARCAARFEHSSSNAVPSGTASCAVATWKQWAECGADQTNASV